MLFRFKHSSKTVLKPLLQLLSSMMQHPYPIGNEDVRYLSKIIDEEKLSLLQHSITLTTNKLCEDITHAAKPIMMTNASENRIKKINNSP